MTASILFHVDPGPAPQGVVASKFVDADGATCYVWEGAAPLIRAEASKRWSLVEVLSETGSEPKSPACADATALVALKVSKQARGHDLVADARRVAAAADSLTTDDRMLPKGSSADGKPISKDEPAKQLKMASKPAKPRKKK